VPGHILLTNSQGTNKLLQRGAKLINTSQDILEAYSLQPIPLQKQSINLTRSEKVILKYLNKNSLTVDKLHQYSKIDIVKLSATLTTMEIKGLIKSSGGTYYSL